MNTEQDGVVLSVDDVDMIAHALTGAAVLLRMERYPDTATALNTMAVILKARCEQFQMRAKQTQCDSVQVSNKTQGHKESFA